MADITDSERGQLFLVGAIALALAFVGLAFLLNSAIFTENLASQGTDTGGIDASKITYATTKNTEDVIYSTNNATNAPEGYNVKTEFEQQSYVANPTVQSASVKQGAAVRVSYRNKQKGLRLTQDEPGDFTRSENSTAAATTNPSPPGDWVLLSPNAEPIADPTDEDYPGTGYGPNELRRFQMTLGDEDEGGSATITISRFKDVPPNTENPSILFQNANQTDITISKSDETVSVSSGSDFTCEAPIRENGRVKINFMSGTVGETDCNELKLIWDGGNTSIVSYGIQVSNGNELEDVKWQIIANDTSYNANAAVTPYSQNRTGQPYIDDGNATTPSTGDSKEIGAIWSVEQTVTYATQDEDYSRTTNVTPHSIPQK